MLINSRILFYFESLVCVCVSTSVLSEFKLFSVMHKDR